MEITAVSIRKCAITIQVISTWCFIAKTIANTRKKKNSAMVLCIQPLKDEVKVSLVQKLSALYS